MFNIVNIISGGRRYHKRCFKCSSCSKKLEPTTVLVNKGALYCKGCHGKVEPKESPKIFTDTSAIKPADGKVKSFSDYNNNVTSM